MSEERNVSGRSYLKKSNGARNISRPYDKRQSILSRLKNAVKGYFSPPSWIQAVIPPGTAEDEQMIDGKNEIEIHQTKPNGHGEREYEEVNQISSGNSKLNKDLEASTPRHDDYKERGTSLKRTLSNLNPDVRTSIKTLKDEDLHHLEPQSKRQALENVIDGQRKSIFSKKLEMKNDSNPNKSLIDRTEFSRTRENDLSDMRQSMTPSHRWGGSGLGGNLSSLETSSSHRWGNSTLGGHGQSLSNFKSSATTLFSASYSENDKTQDISLSSPFYKGPITYGGANAFKKSATSDMKNDEDHNRLLITRKQTNIGLSSTTQKILKVLEKRVPGCESNELFKHNPGLPPLAFVSMKGRYMVTDGTCVQGPPLKQIQTPSRLMLKPNYSLMIAASSNESRPDGNVTDANNQDSQKWTGKMKSEKRYHMKSYSGKQEEIISKDNQSDLFRIKLPPDTRVHFTTPFVSKSPATEATTSYKFSLPTSIMPKTLSSDHSSAFVKNFKFSEPKVRNSSGFPTVESAAAVPGVSPKEKSFGVSATMSSPFSLPIKESSGAQPASLLSSFTVDYNSAIKKSSANEVFDVKPAKELKKVGSVMDVLNRGGATSTTDSATDKSISETRDVPLSMLFKGKSGSQWECPTCMVSNKDEVTTCPCCSAVKPSKASPVTVTSLAASNTLSTISSSSSSNQMPVCSVVTTSNTTQNSVPLNMLFKQSPTDKWKCQTCMVENDKSLTSCPCCSEPKPSSSATSSVVSSSSQNSVPLSMLFKQASTQKWNCPTCMVENSSSLTSCPCCTEPKPGSSSGPGVSTYVQPPFQSDPTKKENSLSALFGIKPGEWKCETCFVQNKADCNKCVACETSKPGSSQKSSDNNEVKKTNEISSAPSPLISIDAVSGGFKFAPGIQFNASDFGNNKSKDTVSGGFKFAAGIQFNASDFGNNESKDNGGSSKNESAKKEATISCGGFKPSFGNFGGSSQAAVNNSGTGVSGGFKFGATTTVSLPPIASAVPSTSISNSILISSNYPVSSVPQNLSSPFATSLPTTSTLNLFPAVQSTSSSAGFTFGQSATPSTSSSSLLQENQNNSSSQSFFNSVRNDPLPSNPFSSGTSSTESKLTSIPTFNFGSSTLTNGVGNSVNPGFFSSKAVAPSSTSQIASFSGMFDFKTPRSENKQPTFKFGTDQPLFGAGGGTIGNTTNQSALPFGGPVSSSSSSSVPFRQTQTVGATAGEQQNTSSFFGGALKPSSSSFMQQQQNVAVVTTQSAFSFNTVSSTAPLFGNSNALAAGTPISLNFNASRQISVDMMDSNTQSPVLPMFGAGGASNVNNQPGFGFATNSNARVVSFGGSSNQKPNQGFSFNPSTAPTFNFSQQPTFNQQASQSWNQPPQQSNAPPPTFAFGANPTFNFSGSSETSNIAFSSVPEPGAQSNPRIIKKALRRKK